MTRVLVKKLVLESCGRVLVAETGTFLPMLIHTSKHQSAYVYMSYGKLYAMTFWLKPELPGIQLFLISGARPGGH